MISFEIKKKESCFTNTEYFKQIIFKLNVYKAWTELFFLNGFSDDNSKERAGDVFLSRKKLAEFEVLITL